MNQIKVLMYSENMKRRLPSEAPTQSYLDAANKYENSEEAIPEVELSRYTLQDLEDAYEHITEKEQERLERELEKEMRDDEAREAAKRTAEQLRLRGEKGYSVDIIPDSAAEASYTEEDLAKQFPLDPLEEFGGDVAPDNFVKQITAKNDPTFFLRYFASDEGGACLPRSVQSLENNCNSWRMSKAMRTEEEWKEVMHPHTLRYYDNIHNTDQFVTQVYLTVIPLFVYVVFSKEQPKKDTTRMCYHTHYYCWSRMHSLSLIEEKEKKKK